MKTFTGVSILVIVAAVLAGILWWFAESVDKAPAAEEVAASDTYDMQGTCNAQNDAEWDSCCEDSCGDFCDNHDQSYFKHYTNKHLCTCWCG